MAAPSLEADLATLNALCGGTCPELTDEEAARIVDELLKVRR